MEKSITRTIELGNETKIEIEVCYYNDTADLDGYVFESKSIVKSVRAELFIDGKSKMVSGGMLHVVDDEKGRFGDMYLKASTVKKVIETIADMHIELSKEFEIKTPTEIIVEENEEARVENEKLEALKKSGFCPKCGSWCYGDCEAAI